MDSHHHHEPDTNRRALPLARSMCWHCQSEITGEYLCGQCVKVQPLSKGLDYFTCFRLPRLLNVDPDQLETAYYELSRTFHPDFFSNKDEAEKGISLGNSALLNAGYRTLKDPIQRAEYLIHLEAGSAKEIRNAPPADLFEEILELKENLDEFRSLSPQDNPEAFSALREKLCADRQTLEQRQAHMETSLFQKFNAWDALQAKPSADPGVQAEKAAVLKNMQEILSNRTYVRNIVEDLVGTIE